MTMECSAALPGLSYVPGYHS